MSRVVGFEKSRTRNWLRLFWVSVAGLLIISLFILGGGIIILHQQLSFDPLGVFFEDWELVYDYGSEVIWGFWQEIPKVEFYVWIVLLTLICTIWVLTRNKRKIIRRKLGELAKYGQNMINVSDRNKNI